MAHSFVESDHWPISHPIREPSRSAQPCQPQPEPQPRHHRQSEELTARRYHGTCSRSGSQLVALGCSAQQPAAALRLAGQHLVDELARGGGRDLLPVIVLVKLGGSVPVTQ